MKTPLLIACLAAFLSISALRAADSDRLALAEELLTLMQTDQMKAPKDLWQKMKPEMVKAYSEVYSEEELRGVIAFYKSPSGQAFHNKGPEIARRLMEAQKRIIPELAQLTAESTPAQKEEARERQCLARIAEIGTALLLYSQDYEGRLPRTLDELSPDYIARKPASAELASPFASDTNAPSYEFLTPGAKLSDLKLDSILLRCKFTSPAGRRSVYRASKKAEMVSDK